MELHNHYRHREKILQKKLLKQPTVSLSPDLHNLLSLGIHDTVEVYTIFWVERWCNLFFGILKL